MNQISGLNLSELFYQQVVKPIMLRFFPEIKYACARMGRGSEVLGYDDSVSTDHDFGPCVQLFLPEDNFKTVAAEIMSVMDTHLPESFEGFSVKYANGCRPLNLPDSDSEMCGSWHGVELYTLRMWSRMYLQTDLTQGLDTLQWLNYSEQFFLLITAGKVFRDDTGELTAFREKFAWFPQPVWLYKIAAQWGKIAEERAYVGRADSVNDTIGATIIAVRMAENMMRLAMLTEKVYVPYPKWFGTCFSTLQCAAQLSPLLERILAAKDQHAREESINNACRFVANLQVEHQIPGAIAPEITTIHCREFTFVDSLQIERSIAAAITDDELKQLPGFGAVDQFISSNQILAVPNYCQALSVIYKTPLY